MKNQESLLILKGVSKRLCHPWLGVAGLFVPVRLSPVRVARRGVTKFSVAGRTNLHS
jgi:hypothetical protein